MTQTEAKPASAAPSQSPTIASWRERAARVLAGEAITRDEARALLDAPDTELLNILDGAYLLRRHFHGNRVNLHMLRNAKSGLCRENCKFCSQAMGAQGGVNRYRMQSVEELVAGAREAHDRGAVKYCMVTATRGPSPKEMETICEAVRQIKAEIPIHICTSLGLLRPGQAEQLAEAGVDRFNHNLETSERYYPEVCDTHTFTDRVNTIRAVKEAGMEACCGGIMGMGETVDDRLDLAFALRELDVESIPVNFLNPRPGTPLGDVPKLSPADCLKSLALFRFVNPSKDIRVAGGREVCLKDQQVFALYAANSLFIDGYLTTDGAGSDHDVEMIRNAGFEVAEISQGA